MKASAGTHFSLGFTLLALLALCGCATVPPRASPEADTAPVYATGDQVARGALAQLGRPYRYGGDGPEAFDCSGLVRYVHNALGIARPRTTREQFEAAKPVEETALNAGDLLFFRIGSRQVSHVAIYVGEGKFVHAPRTGRPVELRPLSDAYFRTRLAGIRRLH